ncbi:MAG: hypothetical protein RL662_1985 [Bacteroidota bacterium]|jgi:septal ring factor EnvC (AmiA/AmiB activator)
MRSLVVGFLFLLLACSALSQTDRKIKELEKKRKQTIQEIDNTAILLKETQKSTATLIDRINLIDEQITSRKQLVSILNQEVATIDEEQHIIHTEIQKLEVSLKSEQQAYVKAIEGVLVKRQKTNKLLFALSGKSFGESMRRIKYLKDYSAWRSKEVVDIKTKHKILQEKRTRLEQSKNDKLVLLNNRTKEQSSLQHEEDTYKQEMAEAKLKQTELQQILATKQQLANNLDGQMERLIAEEVARQEREAKRLAEEQTRQENIRKEKERKEIARKETEKAAATRIASNAKLIASSLSANSKSSAVYENETEADIELRRKPTTRQNGKLSSNFESNKGRLPMPVSGTHRIVGRFGTQNHNKWNVKTNSSGIDIQTQSGAKAQAIFNGEVSRIIAFPGYNNCIIVRHGGYYTFYGNIQQVAVKQGQKVSTGQSLGSIYTDRNAKGAVLHFQLWRGTNKLNPEPWLQK